ncbi:junctional adhesion molecule A-like [Heterodontus francisci]|uniref:junctional adhesion molecule A-like n=1 Tax=Heterodontus francisci TaxID=7792 RepID=UPI00355C27C4
MGLPWAFALLLELMLQATAQDPDKEMKIEAEPKLLWPGQSLLLTCKFSYLLQGELIYSFYREGSRLTKIRSSNKSVSFKMEHVTLEDNGRYRCEVRFAKYPSGRVFSSADTSVMVKESPVRLSVEPKTQKDGDTITLRCWCTDFLLHCGEQYVVYRNNSFLASISMIPAIYRIQKATVMDSGWYHCVASSNDEEYTSRVVEITVKKIPVANTQLHINSSSGKITEGSNLTLTCLVTEGSAPIQYTWYRGETDFHNETSSSKAVTYKIYHFNERNQGQYSCSAYNNAEGKNVALHSRAFELMVEAPEQSYVLGIRIAVLTLFLTASLIALVFVNLPNKMLDNTSRSSQPQGMGFLGIIGRW